MRVLAIAAHPDDIEILCAGTLARYRDAGSHVMMAYVCNGDCGHYDIPTVELAQMRKSEAEAAADLLGARLYTFEDSGDGKLLASEMGRRRQMVDLLRETRPDLIITHGPDDYMPDHREVSKLVFDASFLASLPNWKTESNLPHTKKVPPVYYMDNLAGIGFLPEEYVDITATFEIKRRMLECHQSQITWLKEHDDIDVVEFMTVLARFRGIQSGVQYAEGFRRLTVWPRVTTERLLP